MTVRQWILRNDIKKCRQQQQKTRNLDILVVKNLFSKGTIKEIKR